MSEFNFDPIILDNTTRANMTVSCRDCDLIPKVADAGQVISFEGKPVQIMHNGVRVVAGGYYGDWMMGIIERLRGHHEPQEEVVFHEVEACATQGNHGGTRWFPVPLFALV